MLPYIVCFKLLCKHFTRLFRQSVSSAHDYIRFLRFDIFRINNEKFLSVSVTIHVSSSRKFYEASDIAVIGCDDIRARKTHQNKYLRGVLALVFFAVFLHKCIIFIYKLIRLGSAPEFVSQRVY